MILSEIAKKNGMKAIQIFNYFAFKRYGFVMNQTINSTRLDQFHWNAKTLWNRRIYHKYFQVEM